MSDRSMDIFEKRELIKALNTRQLIDDIKANETELEKVLREENQFRSQNSDLLSGRSDDCAAVKRIEGELAAGAPDKEGEKKLTVADKAAWLVRQRTENKSLAEAVTKQKMAAFTAGDFSIRIEMARARLNDLRGVLALRAAQINFFSSDIRMTVQTEDEIKQEARS
jgi:hypothetical protein